MLPFLLPFLTPTALEMSSQAEVEDALTEGVREALADGWTLADLRGDHEELVITMTKGDKVEQHVAHIDGETNAYRIDVGNTLPLPADPWSATHVAEVLGAGGGLEITSSCGIPDVRTYHRGPRAKGAAAQRLVGAMLATAEDLEHASVEGDRAVFGLALEGRYAELHVGLADGRVIRAELRTYSYGHDRSTFTRHTALKRALGKRVTRIEDTDDGPVLVGARRFALGDDAFEWHDDDEHEGCGC